jgi:hypothetical protein
MSLPGIARCRLASVGIEQPDVVFVELPRWAYEYMA